MRKPIFAIFFCFLAIGAVHCGGDDSTGGSGGSAGRGGTTGNAVTTSSATSSATGAGGAGTGTGGAGGGGLGSCPATQPADGSPCPDDQLHACRFGSTICGCGQGQPWTCFDLDGGFRLDGFSFDGFGFGGG
jgi:hypothetical protein